MIEFALTYKTILFLFAAIQCFIFAGLIILKGRRNNNKSASWLSFFILLGCMYYMPFMFGYANWYAMDGYREFLFFMPFQQLFLIGPVLFFYSRFLLFPETKIQKWEYLHFLPALLYLIYSLYIFIFDYWVYDEFRFYADGRDKDLDYWYQTSGFILMAIYASFSLRLYWAYRKRIYEELSYAESVTFKWYNQFIIIFLIILLLRTGFSIFLPAWGAFGQKFWYYIIFAFLIYYVALAGYTNILESLTPRNLAMDPVKTYNPIITETQQLSGKTKEVGNKPFDENLKNELNQLFLSNKLYRNPGLTLRDLSDLTNKNQKLISQTINNGFNMNFNDYVNQFRIEEIIEKFKNQQHKKYTVLSIALDTGFNSKTSFNRVFKKFTGKSPLQYINELESSA